jgi:hypothetical protein
MKALGERRRYFRIFLTAAACFALAPGTGFAHEPAWPWGQKADAHALAFYQETRFLAARQLRFDQEWLPPGEDQPWVMDCSNTIRYLYKRVAGITLPRKASDQYLCLRSQGEAWDVPQRGGDLAAQRAYLRRRLRPGDLIFWEDTCLPMHEPPITHVMIFLGRTKSGQSILAGSQTGQRIRGVYTGRNGGADIYLYDPTDNIGGYVTSSLLFRMGHVQAIARPLEANAAELAADTAKLL